MISDILYGTSSYALGGYSNVNGVNYAAKTGTTNFDENAKKNYNLPDSAINDLWVIGSTVPTLSAYGMVIVKLIVNTILILVVINTLVYSKRLQKMFSLKTLQELNQVVW